jgi:hypothetical protein
MITHLMYHRIISKAPTRHFSIDRHGLPHRVRLATVLRSINFSSGLYIADQPVSTLSSIKVFLCFIWSEDRSRTLFRLLAVKSRMTRRRGTPHSPISFTRPFCCLFQTRRKLCDVSGIPTKPPKCYCTDISGTPRVMSSSSCLIYNAVNYSRQSSL